jgi:hypothetical protein
MGIDETTEQQFGTAPYFVRGKPRALTGNLVVQMNGVTKGKGPEVTMIVFGPSEGCKDHERATGQEGVFDCIFSNVIVVMATHSTVADALTLGGQFGGEFFRGVNAIAGAVSLHLDTGGGGFPLKTNLGLHRFSAGESNLMDYGQLGTSRITEDSASLELLRQEVIKQRIGGQGEGIHIGQRTQGRQGQADSSSGCHQDVGEE